MLLRKYLPIKQRDKFSLFLSLRSALVQGTYVLSTERNPQASLEYQLEGKHHPKLWEKIQSSANEFASKIVNSGK